MQPWDLCSQPSPQAQGTQPHTLKSQLTPQQHPSAGCRDSGYLSAPLLYRDGQTTTPCLQSDKTHCLLQTSVGDVHCTCRAGHKLTTLVVPQQPAPALQLLLHVLTPGSSTAWQPLAAPLCTPKRHKTQRQQQFLGI